MAGPYAALWRMVEARAPLVVVVYADPASREEWVEEMEMLYGLAGQPVERGVTADDLLERPDKPLIVLPEPESEAELIEQLSVTRDRLYRRTAPAALFLERDGPGLGSLSTQPAIASFLQGVVVDPEAEGKLDLKQERQRFMDATGESPDGWLVRYRSNELPDTLDHALLYLRALLLERGQ